MMDTATECRHKPHEHPVPKGAFMLPSGFLSITDIHIEGADEDLDLQNVVFLDGGSQVWVDEDTEVVWVWHCHRGTPGGRDPRPTAYQGVRRACTCRPT